MNWEELATSNSGYTELEKAWLREAKRIFELFCQKQKSYGPGNIAALGEKGVVVRVNDKVQRLLNVHFHDGQATLETRCECGRVLSNETLDDTWRDLANYGIIARLCRNGEWPNA